MEVVIDVVEIDGRNLFLYKEKTYNCIGGIVHFLYHGGSFTIWRDGAIFDDTKRFRYCGAQDDGVAFCDLKRLGAEVKLFNGIDQSWGFIGLHFKEGDRIVISSPVDIPAIEFNDLLSNERFIESLEKKVLGYN